MSHPDADPTTLARLAAELADRSDQDAGVDLRQIPVPPETPALPARRGGSRR